IEDKDKSASDKSKALKEVKKEIKSLKIKNSKEGKKVNSKLKEVENASSDETKADKLSELTKALIAYEDKQSSKDASGKIKELKQAVDAKDAPMKKAIKDKNQTELQSLNNQLNTIWTSNETVIRNYDDGKYGQIEVNLMQLRVAVQKEPL
ncbi:hypothetical protein, partial [Enterococcus faecium]